PAVPLPAPLPISHLRGSGFAGRDSAAHGRRPGAARVRRLDARTRAPRPGVDTRHGTGARTDPQTARREERRTYMMMTHALGWALADSLWQEALAGAGLAALLALLPVRAARTRYALAPLTQASRPALPLPRAARSCPVPRGGGPPGRAAAHQPARARAAVGRGAGARRHGVAAAGDPPSGECPDGTHRAPARRAARARAGPRAAIRLSRQPRPV